MDLQKGKSLIPIFTKLLNGKTQLVKVKRSLLGLSKKRSERPLWMFCQTYNSALMYISVLFFFLTEQNEANEFGKNKYKTQFFVKGSRLFDFVSLLLPYQ